MSFCYICFRSVYMHWTLPWAWQMVVPNGSLLCPPDSTYGHLVVGHTEHPRMYKGYIILVSDLIFFGFQSTHFVFGELVKNIMFTENMIIVLQKCNWQNPPPKPVAKSVLFVQSQTISFWKHHWIIFELRTSCFPSTKHVFSRVFEAKVGTSNATPSTRGMA